MTSENIVSGSDLVPILLVAVSSTSVDFITEFLSDATILPLALIVVYLLDVIFLTGRLALALIVISSKALAVSVPEIILALREPAPA